MHFDIVDGQVYPRQEWVACPLCGALNEPRLIPVRFGMKAMVAECVACRLAYQTPRPAPEACLAYMNRRWSSSDAYVADREYQRRRARLQLSYISGLSDPPGRLLDFGAGVGTFVRVARESGWQAVGVERSTIAVERAWSENGVVLAPSLPEGPFDAVTMWDVIEHLHNPVDTIQALKALLRRGGRLFVETGNWESWLRLAAGDNWDLYLFDHHYYFSPASLQKLLESCGLSNFVFLDFPAIPSPFVPRLWTLRHPLQCLKRCRAYIKGHRLWGRHSNSNGIVIVAQVV